MTEPLVEAIDVDVSFGLTPALQGATLAVDSGEFLAITGPSGSGKSTLLHCLAGLLTPDRGQVRFDGQRVDDLPDRQRTQLRRTDFGFVFQFGQLIPELTAADNIAMPLLLHGSRRGPALRTARAWLPRLGLSELGPRRTGELSGGQAQRIAIGRALVMQPRVLFADEPTGALDTLAGEQVMALLTKIARDAGTTVILVTHDPRVASYADRVVRVTDGAVSELGIAAGVR
jgi:putative ABC transport system ATP-binding protein